MTNLLLSDPTVTQGGLLRLDVRCHQVDNNGDVVRDLTDFFIPEGSVVDRNSCNTSDAVTARLNFGFTRDEVRDVFDADAVPWSSMRLRPSMRLGASDNSFTDWVSLGVFLPETPRVMADQTPKEYAVDCHDLIYGLSSATNGTLAIVGGSPVGQAIEALFNLETLTQHPTRVTPPQVDPQEFTPISRNSRRENRRHLNPASSLNSSIRGNGRPIFSSTRHQTNHPS